MRFKRGDVLLYKEQPNWDIDYTCKIRWVWWFGGWFYKLEFSDKSGSWWSHSNVTKWFYKPSKLDKVLE